MRAFSRPNARKWCETQGATLASNGFPTTRRKTKSFSIPADAGRRVAMVAEHLEPYRTAAKTLVWFDDWAVWPSGQRMHIFERFLASYGEARPLIDAPAFLFSEREYEDLVLLFYSHDEHGWVAPGESTHISARRANRSERD